MNIKDIEAKMTEIVKSQCKDITGTQLTLKALDELKKAYTNAIQHVFSLEKKPRLKDFSFDVTSGKAKATFKHPAVYKLEVNLFDKPEAKTVKEDKEWNDF